MLLFFLARDIFLPFNGVKSDILQKENITMRQFAYYLVRFGLLAIKIGVIIMIFMTLGPIGVLCAILMYLIFKMLQKEGVIKSKEE